MSFDKLRNCSRCGNLFVYTIRPYCPECVKKVEKEFELCAQFLRKRENRSSTMEEMSAKTGVSVSQITDFVREKRLMISDHPNMGYPCDSCGKVIRSGSMCDSCSNEWKKSLDGLGIEKVSVDGEKRKSGYLNKR